MIIGGSGIQSTITRLQLYHAVKYSLRMCMETYIYLSKIKFSQFEIVFLTSTGSLWMCLFCLQVDMLCCFNVQIFIPELVIQIQNTIWNTFVWYWQFERHTLQICKSQPWLNTQLSIIIIGLLTQMLHAMYWIIQRWQTKGDLSIPEYIIWCSQWHLVDYRKGISNHENLLLLLELWMVRLQSYR